MKNPDTDKPRPAVDPRDIAPEKRDDVQHVVDTGLPPGINPEEAADPGKQTPGTSPDFVRGK